MIWLIVSILTNTLLLLILKGFEKYGVNTLHGIVVNYFVAATTGLCLVGIPDYDVLINGAGDYLWIPFSLGFLFISIFFLIGKTAQEAGVSVATVANKMSVVIPVVAAVVLYNESLGGLKVIGIVAALAAVWMTSKQSQGAVFNRRMLLLPAVIFIGSGIIDAMVNHLQRGVPDKLLIPFLLSMAFMSALVIGTITVSYRAVVYKEYVKGRSILGGIILGIPNYFSIYAVTKALDANIMETSALYPVNNMGIVICSAVGALLIFREQLSRINWLGILLSVLAIALIAFT
jgi:drug/metabolite transporter (DMT)-like permease